MTAVPVSNLDKKKQLEDLQQNPTFLYTFE